MPIRRFLLHLALAMLVSAPAARSAPLPDGFALPRPSGNEDTFVFARIAGSNRQPIDRPAIEAACDLRRAMDPGTPRPLFESGWDQPNRFESLRYENAASRIIFRTDRAYACANAATVNAAHQPCGCQYRIEESRTTLLRRPLGDGRVEDLTLQHARRQVRRTVLPTPMTGLGPDEAAALAARLAPQPAGMDKVVGLACAVRRKDIGGGNAMEWCITTNDAPDPRLRSRSLWHRKLGADGVEVASERTVELVTDARLDRAAFTVPEGYTVQGSRDGLPARR
jgi:hypothetical protein